MSQVKISYDGNGTPGITAEDPVGGQWGLGFVHGKHRPLQTLLLSAAARGCLAERLWPKRSLVELDLHVKRWALWERAQRAAASMSMWAAARVDAYLAGVCSGLRASGRPFELRLLGARLPLPDRASVLGGLLVSGWLSQARGQATAEALLVQSVRAGADGDFLQSMHHPHLRSWSPGRYVAADADPPLVGRALGGSNAWALDGRFTRGGRILHCADPHLEVNQLPSLFFEVRARLHDGGRGDPDYWLGATLPGLPGLAIGRNRRVAFGGTYAVGDSADFLLQRPETSRGELHQVRVARRFGRSHESLCRFRLGGVDDGSGWILRWALDEHPERSLEAYLRLLETRSASEAERVLCDVQAMSLHYILADRDGHIAYRQVGCLPERYGGWSGLYPGDPEHHGWSGVYQGAALPGGLVTEGLEVSANEHRPSVDGTPLSTLPQPRYRRDRILEVLREGGHSLESVQRLQLDRRSLQADRLLPWLLPHLGDPTLREALEGWDRVYASGSTASTAFETVRRVAIGALAPSLGGDWFTWALDHTALTVSWCEALDRLLASSTFWRSEAGARAAQAVGRVRGPRRPWGEHRRFVLRHMLLGGLPGGGDRGPVTLPGSIATVCQSNILSLDESEVVVGPAYRWVCDLAEDAAYTALPGGIDGSRFSDSYVRWLDDWCRGRYHRIAPPGEDEAIAGRAPS